MLLDFPENLATSDSCVRLINLAGTKSFVTLIKVQLTVDSQMNGNRFLSRVGILEKKSYELPKRAH